MRNQPVCGKSGLASEWVHKSFLHHWYNRDVYSKYSFEKYNFHLYGFGDYKNPDDRSEITPLPTSRWSINFFAFKSEDLVGVRSLLVELVETFYCIVVASRSFSCSCLMNFFSSNFSRILSLIWHFDTFFVMFLASCLLQSSDLAMLCFSILSAKHYSNHWLSTVSTKNQNTT